MTTRSGFPSLGGRPWPRLSFAGRFFVVVALLALALGFALEIDAPLLVAALQLALLLASLPFSRALRRVSVSLLGGAVVEEGLPRSLALRLNHEGLTPIGGVEVWLRGAGIQGRGVSLLLAGGDSQDIEVQVRGLRRGKVEELYVYLETRAPFGLLVHRHTLLIPVEVLVLPRSRLVRHTFLREILARSSSSFEQSLPVGPGDGEFYSLQEMRPEEPERRVHPRLSARRGRKVRCEYRGMEPSRVHVLLDGRLPKSYIGKLGGEYEHALRTVVGLIRALLRQGVRVHVWEWSDGRFVSRCGVHASLGQYLAAIAVLKVERTGEESLRRPSFAEDPGPGYFLLLHAGLIDPEETPGDWLSLCVGTDEFERALERAEMSRV